MRLSMKMKIQILSTYILIFFATGETQKSPVIYRSCRDKYDCGGAFGYVCGHNQTCYCDRFYILNSNGDKCVGGVGQMCRYDEHCIEGAFCQFQIKCECKDDLYPSENGLACSRSRQKANSGPDIYAITILFLYLIKVI